jgi:hypothetical protein
MTTEAHTEEQIATLLTQVGFDNVRFFPSLVGIEVEEESQSANFVVLARRRIERANVS